MALWKFSLREVASRPGRAILTLLSVVIGVAMVVSVSAATSTTRQVFADMYVALTGRAALEVSARGGGGFDERVVSKIAKVTDVAAAAPLITVDQIIHIHFKDETQPHSKGIHVTVMAIDPKLDQAVRDYQLVSGQWLDDQAKILVDDSFARNFDLKVGDKFAFLGATGKPIPVAGFVSPRGASAVGLGVVYMNIKIAQKRLQGTQEGQIDRVQVVVRKGADPAKVATAIKAVLPKTLQVMPPTTRTQQGEELMLSSSQGMVVATGFSWALAFIIVLNTFQMNVAERRRQLSIMRAVGATRGQIMRMVCREGLVMGVVGTVLGIAVGIAGAVLLSRAMALLLQTGLPKVHIGYLPIVLAAIAGPAISVLGVIYPAWRAGQLSPLEGMGAVLPSEMESPSWIMASFGLVLFLAGGALLVGSIVGYVPINIEFKGGATLNTPVLSALALMIALMFFIPVLLRPLARVVSFILAPLLRVEGRLAEGQIVRRRGRTTLTIAVMFFALTFVVGLGNNIVNSVGDVRSWYQNSIRGDYFVRAMMPSNTTGRAASVPKEMGSAIRAIRGVASVKPVSWVSMEIAGQAVTAVVADFNGPDRREFNLVEGDPSKVHDLLAEGQVIIGTVLAQRTKWHEGTMIPLQTLKGEKMIRVAGTTNDYTAGGLTMYMQDTKARKLIHIPGVSAYIVKAAPGKVAEVGAALKVLCRDQGVLLQSYKELISMIEGMMTLVVAALWGLLWMVFIVSTLGVVNTLAMNVIEQTRELGLLRIVAMTRRQVRKLILSQAALLAALGLVPGVFTGFGIAYLMNLALTRISGHPIVFSSHPLLMVECFVAAFAIVLCAAWFPAARAARLELVEALKYQ